MCNLMIIFDDLFIISISLINFRGLEKFFVLPRGRQCIKFRRHRSLQNEHHYAANLIHCEVFDIFKIRFLILEARQLQGGTNISAICRVMCFKQVRKTRVKKGTASPFWNELFFFNFHSSSAELFDQMIEIEVCSSLHSFSSLSTEFLNFFPKVPVFQFQIYGLNSILQSFAVIIA